MSALPTQAIDPRCLAEILRQPIDSTGHPMSHREYRTCGCDHDDIRDRWQLCAYHDGMNDGMNWTEVTS